MIEHLKGLFGEVSAPLVIMFQEVRRESLQVILESPWVQRNFVLSNSEPPESAYTDIPGESFVLRQLDWDAAPYFTLMMVSRHLAVKNCFRVPFVTNMGRDALVVDISVLNLKGLPQAEEVLRLCTTHLESLWGGKAYRPGQLGLISGLMKGSPSAGSRIIAGLVGGDMNAIDPSADEFHKASEVGLRDVWEDVPAPPVPVLKPFQKDLSYGRARGNTWGYQSSGSRNRKRLDKFFYTGSIETVSLRETEDLAGRIGRIGLGLKTEVEAWEAKPTKMRIVRGRCIEKRYTEYYSDQVAARMRHTQMVRTKTTSWVSDHFGIAVGIKVI